MSNITKSRPKKTVQTVVEQKRVYLQLLVRCSKSNCRCVSGKLHGPYWYMLVRDGRTRRHIYIGKTLDLHKYVSPDGTPDIWAINMRQQNKRAPKIPATLTGTCLPVDNPQPHDTDLTPDLFLDPTPAVSTGIAITVPIRPELSPDTQALAAATIAFAIAKHAIPQQPSNAGNPQTAQ